MSDWLTTRQLQHLQRGYRKRVETPIPTQVVSSGECFPPPQSRRQAQAEVLMREKTDFYAGRQGMPRQRYLRSPSGMAAASLWRCLSRRSGRGRGSGGCRRPAQPDPRPVYLRRPHSPRARGLHLGRPALAARCGAGQQPSPHPVESRVGRAGAGPEVLQVRLLRRHGQRHHARAVEYLALGRSRKNAVVRSADGRHAGPSQ